MGFIIVTVQTIGIISDRLLYGELRSSLKPRAGGFR